MPLHRYKTKCAVIKDYLFNLNINHTSKILEANTFCEYIYTTWLHVVP